MQESPERRPIGTKVSPVKGIWRGVVVFVWDLRADLGKLTLTDMAL